MSAAEEKKGEKRHLPLRDHQGMLAPCDAGQDQALLVARAECSWAHGEVMVVHEGGDMKRRRLAMAVAVGLLLAIGVAVPVVANGGLTAIPAESGYIRMAPHEATWTADSTTTYTVAAPSTVRLVYDTKVMLDQSDGPTSWALVATKLPYLGGGKGIRKAAGDSSDQSWTLVQIDAAGYYYEDGDIFFWDVTRLGDGIAKKGFLAMKGQSYITAPEWRSWHRFTGWEVWLVPTDDLQSYEVDNEEYWYLETDEHFCVESDWFMPLLGGPAQLPDYQDPYWDQP